MARKARTILAIFASVQFATDAALAVPLTCADLPSNDTFDVSFEGSWSGLHVDPKGSPFSMGLMAYSVITDYFPHIPLFQQPLALKVKDVSCETTSYTWYPDHVQMQGTCGTDLDVTMRIAYRSNATVCADFHLAAAANVQVLFEGVIPETFDCSGAAPNCSGYPYPQASGIAANASSSDDFILMEIHAYSDYGGPVDKPVQHRTHIDRWWLMQASEGVGQVALSDGAYSFPVDVMEGVGHEVAFCFTELETLNHDLPAFPGYDETPARKNIDKWFAEAHPPAGILDNEQMLRQYYTSWYQFWFNTEHEAGQWVGEAITPSMSQYARGVWLWDSAFHAFALLAGGRGEPRSLKKAQDQLAIMTTAGAKLGHIPRVVGATGIETQTQPPGILTWATLVIYNHTQDRAFLETAYVAFSQNNDWFYRERGTPSGLCTWGGEDSGWDNSPRWDQGDVEAVDLNAWLRIDQLLLARIAEILDRPADEKIHWLRKANASAAAIQSYLWDESSGIFWDRLPDSGTFVDVVTPATFWALLAGVGTTEQAARMLHAVLTPERLNTTFAMPVVGRSESTFDPNRYWRGPVWANVNWLSALGLECYGYRDTARFLRKSTTSVVGLNPYPREYYNPLVGHGLGAKNFMWTGAVNIVILNELDGNALAGSILHEGIGCPAAISSMQFAV